MAKTTLTIRIEAELLQAFRSVCTDRTMTDVIIGHIQAEVNRGQAMRPTLRVSEPGAGINILRPPMTPKDMEEIKAMREWMKTQKA